MPENITFNRARIAGNGKLGYNFLPTANQAGEVVLDLSKVTVTSDSGVAISLMSVSALLALAGTANLPWWAYPQFGHIGDGTTPAVHGWIPLSRQIKQSENITVNFQAAAVSDGTNTSAATGDRVATVHTGVQEDGTVGPDGFRRVGCGNRPKVDPATLSPVLRIKASDFAADGDGNNITARAATVGGTITPSGAVKYRADGVASGLVTGSTGAPVIEIPSGGSLTTTVALGSSTADYTILIMVAFASSSGQIANNTPLDFGVSNNSTFRRVFFRDLGGRYENAASEQFKRLQIAGMSYNHANTRFRIYGYGGSFITAVTEATGNDHSTAISITASGSAAYVTEVLLMPNEAAIADVRGVGSTWDDEYNTTNRIFFLDPTLGNDTNSGLTEAAPRASAPTSGGGDSFAYGAGDGFVLKHGETLLNTSFTFSPAFNATLGYSSEFPFTFGSYGDPADGPAMVEGRTSNVELEMSGRVAYFHTYGLTYSNERRNPLSTHYAGYSAVKDDSDISFNLLGSTAGSAAWLVGTDDPAMVQATNCESRYANKGFLDCNGANQGENWFALTNCTVYRNWQETLSGTKAAAGPSAMFCQGSVMALIDGLLGYQVASWFEPASIGGHSAGARVFTSEASATYNAGTDETTVTLAGAFSELALTKVSLAISASLLVTKRTSDATEIDAAIKSKTSDNEIVLYGNPYGLADAATITDALLFGGWPSMPDGRNHLVYLQGGQGGGHLMINCVGYDIAANMCQLRSGGWEIDNIAIDSANGMQASGHSRAVIDGNFMEGGRGNFSDTPFSGSRCWGIQAFGSSSPPSYVESHRSVIQNNILNQSPTAFGSDVIPNQFDTGAFSLQTEGSISTVQNNTVLRLLGTAIKRNETVDDHPMTVRRNIVQGYDEGYGSPLLIGTNFLDQDVSNNAFYLPAGSGADLFNGGDKNFAEFVADSIATDNIFNETTFSAAIPISLMGEYNGTLGGTATKQGWADAALAARRAGSDGAYSAPSTLAWLRERVRPTNRTALEGGGIVMGAAALADAPTLSVTDTAGDALADPVTFSTSRLTTPTLTRSFRLNASGGDIAGADITVTLSGIAMAITYAESGGATIPSLSGYTITDGDYITATVTLNRLTIADGQTGSVEFAAGDAGTVTANYEVDVKVPLTVAKTDTSPFGDPETASTTLGSNVARTARLTAGPSGLTGINIGTSGIVGLPGFGTIPAALGGSATADVALSLSASETGPAQPGVFAVSANGGVSETVNFELTVEAADPLLPVLTLTLDGSLVMSGQTISRTIAQPSETPLAFTLVLTEINGIAATLGTLAVTGDLTITGTNPSGGTISAEGTEMVALEFDISEIGVSMGTLSIPVDELDEPLLLVFRASVGLSGMRSRDRSRER